TLPFLSPLLRLLPIPYLFLIRPCGSKTGTWSGEGNHRPAFLGKRRAWGSSAWASVSSKSGGAGGWNGNQWERRPARLGGERRGWRARAAGAAAGAAASDLRAASIRAQLAWRACGRQQPVRDCPSEPAEVACRATTGRMWLAGRRLVGV
ncbi:unnamed protein product, partial [Urochloa humidicola]